MCFVERLNCFQNPAKTKRSAEPHVLTANQSAWVDRTGTHVRALGGRAPLQFVRSMPDHNARILADLRFDLDHHAPAEGERCEGKIRDTHGDGTWSFYCSCAENPNDRRADLKPLIYTNSAKDVRNGGSYVTPAPFLDLPAVKNGQLIADSQGFVEGTPPSDAVAVHPGHEAFDHRYLVIRWRAGNGEIGRVAVAGVLRDIGIVGDGVTFAVYAGKVLCVLPSIANNYAGQTFEFNADVKSGGCIDFVIGCNVESRMDQSSLAVKLHRLPQENEDPQPNK